jgi:hypothetical protein
MVGVPRYGLTRKSERTPDGWPVKDSDFVASAFPFCPVPLPANLRNFALA